jgi:hypothetical protein
VRYEIHIDNDGDARPDVTYRFEFSTRYRNPDTFLYNTGPITSLDSPNWNRRQFARVTRIVGAQASVLATDLACPPCNIGRNSTPDYASLAAAAVHRVGDTKVFTGQRAEGFYVDLGAIFDLGILRPFLQAHLAHMPAAPGINATKAKNIHTIALQVPIKDLTADGRRPTNVKAATAVLGVYAEASRQRAKIYHHDGTTSTAGPWQQISRQGHPLINEVLIPIPRKDRWNSQEPHDDAQFADHYEHPELSRLLNVLYPGVFPNLAQYKKRRADVVAILLTGIPASVLPSAPTYSGPVQADLLRLNVAVPPKTDSPSNLGVLGGDVAGYPNGRRVFDDVTTIELRALAGATIPLVDPSYKPDAAAGAITQGLTSSHTDMTAENTVHYLPRFPYLGTPHDGYHNPPDNSPAPDLHS